MEERLGLKQLSSGMIFRAEMEAETDLGRLARRYIDQGELVPDGVTIEMMAKRFTSNEVRRRGFILDGFPRTVEQASALLDILNDLEQPLSRVVSLEVEDEEVVKRLSGRMGCTKCGEIYHSSNKPPKREGICDRCNSPLFVREDDKPETIRERLRVYHSQTEPVIEYLEGRVDTIHTDASKDQETIYLSILEGLKR
jgi:adenylate kinase